MRRTLRCALAGLATLMLLPSTAAGTGAHCAQDQQVESFDISAEPRRNVYHLGGTAIVDLYVTDKATGQPVADVGAGIVIDDNSRKDGFFTYGETNDQGHVAARLPLRSSYLDPGPIRATAVAWDPIITPVLCTGRYGQRHYEKLFRLRA